MRFCVDAVRDCVFGGEGHRELPLFQLILHFCTFELLQRHRNQICSAAASEYFRALLVLPHALMSAESYVAVQKVHVRYKKARGGAKEHMAVQKEHVAVQRDQAAVQKQHVAVLKSMRW